MYIMQQPSRRSQRRYQYDQPNGCDDGGLGGV